ncbi:MAG: hypothetical protein K2Y37_24295 [Pirellulales bacterium]|nr:hypothetical protein [Pirellulales bacterium]
MHEAVKHELDRLRREVANLAVRDAPLPPNWPKDFVATTPATPPLPPVCEGQAPPLPVDQPAELSCVALSDTYSSDSGYAPSSKQSAIFWLANVLQALMPQAPGWLVSATLHAGLLVALALATITAKPSGRVATLSVVWSEADATGDAVVELPKLIVRPEVADRGAPNEEITRDAHDAETITGGTVENIAAPTAAVDYVGASSDPGLGDEVAAAVGHGGELPGIPGPDEGEDKEEPVLGKGYASFCGLEAKGYRFVFIVDSSGSMQGPRFIAACHQLMASITDLDEHQSFYVIFFNATEYPQAWPHIDNEMSPAGLSSTERIGQWMRGVIPNGWTNPDGAIRRGLDLKPDAIFLLTDGEFNQGSALSVIRRHKFRAAIHTVAFGSPEGAPMLQEIATRTGGTFRYLPE